MLVSIYLEDQSVDAKVTFIDVQVNRSVYGDAIPGHVLADRIASYVHIFNLYWYVR